MKTNSVRYIVSLFILLSLSSCATRLDLVSPENIDLSGTWVIGKKASQLVSKSEQRGSRGTGPNNHRDKKGKNNKARDDNSDDRSSQDDRPARGLSRTPAMKATEMTIEQNHDSMGIAYPNELYRDIDWGKKEFYRETVSAGWQGDVLIVKSASDQMTLTETYKLNKSRDRLTLTLSIKDQRGTNEFDRIFILQK